MPGKLTGCWTGGADVDARNQDGYTPLHWAAMDGHVETAALLLDRGADLEARDAHGATPLHGAAACEQPGTAALLLDRGADVDARDERGATPLHYALKKGHARTVEVLRKHGSADKPPGKPRSRILRHAVGL